MFFSGSASIFFLNALYDMLLTSRYTDVSFETWVDVGRRNFV